MGRQGLEAVTEKVGWTATTRGTWDGTGRDPPNGRKAKKGKSNKNGKPKCMDEMDDKRKEAELGEIWGMKRKFD